MHDGHGNRAALGWLVIVALATSACAADMSPLDAPAGDRFAWDASPPRDQGSPGDGPVGIDAQPADARTADAQTADRGPAVDDGGPDPCAVWSAWTCDLDPVLLCRATCPAGPQQLSCINSGACVCGVSTGPCGTFSAAEPCDVCRQAVEGGCCNP